MMKVAMRTIVLALGVAAGAGLLSAPARSQQRADASPTNTLPNPYRTVEGYFKMPAGRSWGSTSAVEIDKDGRSVWVAERCGANSCRDSNLPPILEFDESGALVRS